MHFEILVEDMSGKRALDILVPKIIGNGHTFRVLPYKGIGRIPKGLRSTSEASKRILLDQLPKLLRGYGKTFRGYLPDYRAAVIVVADLDDKCLRAFRKELFDVLAACRPRPNARFCIAIEEGEAWLLGDIPAIKRAYPYARESVLGAYANDAICGTWETLADAVCSGGAAALSRSGWSIVGKLKSEWAESIAPHMNVEQNSSPSFRYFRDTLCRLADAS